MRIIFLDIDGVLNSCRSYTAYGHLTIGPEFDRISNEIGYLTAKTKLTIDPIAVELINKLSDKPDIKIVVSSSHRFRFRNELLKMRKYMKFLGLTGHVLSGTADLKLEPDGHKYCRGDEIKLWVDNTPLFTKYTIDSYVIIDDDNDFLPEQKPHHIKVDSNNGFSYNNYLDSIQILM